VRRRGVRGRAAGTGAVMWRRGAQREVRRMSASVAAVRRAMFYARRVLGRRACSAQAYASRRYVVRGTGKPTTRQGEACSRLYGRNLSTTDIPIEVYDGVSSCPPAGSARANRRVCNANDETIERRDEESARPELVGRGYVARKSVVA